MSDKPDFGEGVLQWWRDLNNESGPMRAARARLRRLRSVVTPRGRELPVSLAYEEAMYWRLHRLLGRDHDHERSLVCAAVLAQVHDNHEQELPLLLAASRKGGDGPVCAEQRFKRLVRVEEMADLLNPLVQVVRLLDGRAPVVDLANSIVFWGPKRRRRWAQRYWSGVHGEHEAA